MPEQDRKEAAHVPMIHMSVPAAHRHFVVIGTTAAAGEAQSALERAGARVERLETPEALGERSPVLAFVDTGASESDQAFVEALNARGIPAHRLADIDGGVRIDAGYRSRDLSASLTATGGPPVEADLWRRFVAALPPNYARLQSWVVRHTPRVNREIPDPAKRDVFWRELLQGWVAEAVMGGQETVGDAELDRMLASPDRTASGSVYLVGAGPGDPDLLTLRAVRILQMADVVLYDRLVAPGVLDIAPSHARRVYVGKRRSHHAVPQETINEMLVRFASEGRRVVRLKGGDPFIFGRGGEEIDQLMARGIRFEVIPGITAASGCAAYAGIPLTHRDYAQSCVFTTGHRRADGSLQIDFDGLVRPAQTIVFYMGLSGVKALADGLMAHGMPRETPAALIQQGTTLNQRVVSGPLERLGVLAEASRLRAPTLVIVGEVVRLREQLAWFEPRGGDAPFWTE